MIASGDIRTSTADGSTPEISTAGNALLVAGEAIGNEGRRIELSGVTTLATNRPIPSGSATAAATLPSAHSPA